MPLTDLIRYFNAADSAGRSTLYPVGERVEAWHDGLRLSSLFQPIADLSRQRIVGHQARLSAALEDGQPVSLEQAYARQQSPSDVVHFDRMNRTLHALNFLAQRRHAGGYLQLTMHPRHLKAVQSQHGLVYEAILKRCGLGPEDIVLTVDAGEFSENPKLGDALINYRQRGYRLALDALRAEPATEALLALRPDLLLLPLDANAVLLDSVRRLDIAVQLCGIETGRDIAQANAAGARLGQGSLFGLPHRACRATHSKGGVAYNSSSPTGVPS